MQYAKDNGIKRVTLEVPGASPDAQHIYEKFGFKKTGQLTSNDMWGGLTSMELLIEGAVKHADRSLLDYILEALDQVTENEGLMQMNTTDELRHFGVKGMKWGVRKDRIRKGRAEREINAKIQRNDKWGKSKRRLRTVMLSASSVTRSEVRLALGDSLTPSSLRASSASKWKRNTKRSWLRIAKSSELRSHPASGWPAIFWQTSPRMS